MDELIIRSLQGLATDEEEKALHVWRQTALQNERYYRDMARVWRHAELVEPAAAQSPPTRAVAALPTAPGTRRIAGGTARARLKWAARPLAVAAALVVGIGIGAFVLDSPDTSDFASAELVTGANEMVTTRLGDGTIVRLGEHSRLRVSDSGGNREVWLDGRAFFAVAREEGRRFVVRTRAGDAVVLGTRFDVQIDDDGMQVFVVEGKVAHHAGGREVEVSAMEVSRASHGAAPDVSAVDDPAPLLDWLGEFMVFRSTPIRDVAREIERHFQVEVRIADASVADRTVTAWFTDESLEDVLLIVCRAADAHCLVRDNVVTIEP
jgi:ferric-dicitrate binding protein FerR (iron transport regulator)